MTYAPRELETARDYLIATTPLSGAAVGIVGSDDHKRTGTSYHLGKDDLDLWKNPYSVYESSRDQDGLSDAAAALDVGNWPGLQDFSVWLVGQCEDGAADTRDIREVIYSPDGQAVKRWDRLGRRSSGGSSHRWHTHISYFRDSEVRDKVSLFERYFEGGHASAPGGGSSTSDPDRGGIMFPKEGDRDSGTDEAVEFWQRVLKRTGEELPQYGTDGDFGDETTAAVNSSRDKLGWDPVDPGKITAAHGDRLLKAAYGGGGVSSSAIEAAVADYLEANPPEPGEDGKTPSRVTIELSGDVTAVE